MHVLPYGPKSDALRPLLLAHGFTLADESGAPASPGGKPELIACYGGDGTVLHAEQEFPGVPKLILKGSRICKLCSKLGNEEVLARVGAGRFTTREFPKLEAEANGTTLVGMNDIIVHNADARHGIRYRLLVNGEALGGEIIGDGIVVATPLGSTGYYRSITDSFFTVGIGIAFNNSTEQSDHMVVGDGSVIRLSVTRGPAVVYADNNPVFLTLEDGGEVTISKSAATARLLSVEA